MHIFDAIQHIDPDRPKNFFALVRNRRRRRPQKSTRGRAVRCATRACVPRARLPPGTQYAVQNPARAHRAPHRRVACALHLAPAGCWHLHLLPASHLSRACSARLAASHQNDGAAHAGLAHHHHAWHRLSMARGVACWPPASWPRRPSPERPQAACEATGHWRGQRPSLRPPESTRAKVRRRRPDSPTWNGARARYETVLVPQPGVRPAPSTIYPGTAQPTTPIARDAPPSHVVIGRHGARKHAR